MPLVIAGLEQVSSFICCRVMADQSLAWKCKLCFSEKLGIRPKTGFLAQNFGHRCASKSIKSSIDADFHLVFNKTLSQKNESMGWGPGPAKGGQHFQNMPSLWHHLQKIPYQNQEIFSEKWHTLDLKGQWCNENN